MSTITSINPNNLVTHSKSVLCFKLLDQKLQELHATGKYNQKQIEKIQTISVVCLHDMVKAAIAFDTNEHLVVASLADNFENFEKFKDTDVIGMPQSFSLMLNARLSCYFMALIRHVDKKYLMNFALLFRTVGALRLLHKQITKCLNTGERFDESYMNRLYDQFDSGNVMETDSVVTNLTFTGVSLRSFGTQSKNSAVRSFSLSNVENLKYNRDSKVMMESFLTQAASPVEHATFYSEGITLK